MVDRADLRKIAHARLRDADALIRNRRYDGAIYLCGYAVEIALKARICKTLRWQEFPSGRAYGNFRTHDLDVLLHLSGVEERIKGSCFVEWSVVGNWDPGTRYKPIDSANKGRRDKYGYCSENAGEGIMKLKSKLEAAVKSIEKMHGRFTLFGLFLREDSPDKWDLVVAAPWLEEGKLRALGDFVDELRDTISEEEMLSLSRIVTLNYDDPALDAILSGVTIKRGTVQFQDVNLFGLAISHAYIMRAVKDDRASVHPS